MSTVGLFRKVLLHPSQLCVIFEPISTIIMLKNLVSPHFVSGITCISLWGIHCSFEAEPFKSIFWLFTCLFLIGESENLESRDFGEWNMN